MRENPNDKPFIAELHDIGKLVDRDALKSSGIQIRGHTFHDFDFSKIGISQPSSPSWYAQYLDVGDLKSPDEDMLNSQEVNKWIPDVQIRGDVLITKIADGIAAAISRLELYGRHIRRGQVSEGIYKLWNPEFYEKKKRDGANWSPFTNVETLKNMFQYVDSCKNYQDFLRDYRNYLDLTPEDKTAPGNIVSLYTHLKLVGKIYRILKKHSTLLLKDNQNVLIYDNQPINSVRDACGHIDHAQQPAGKWVFRMISCNIKTHHSFSRLQDLNVFKKRNDLVKAFSEDENTRDYVLFHTDDFMFLFIPKEGIVKIKELLKPFLDAGFTIDYREMEAELNLLTSSMERAYERFHSKKTNRYLKLCDKSATSELPAEIQPPLCDSCQMRQGKERVKDNIHEYLCDTCYDIREMGEPAREYAEWEEKGLRAAWMKITLDQEDLLNTIQKLYEEYVDTHPAMEKIPNNDKIALKESFRPLAVQMDFIEDYKSLLKAFNEQIYSIEDTDGKPLFTKESFLIPIDDYYEFGIFKVYSGKEILAVLDLFYSLMKNYFPKCLQYSPIKLSLSVAQVKYPYQEHWRFLSKPENSINLLSPGSVKLSLDLEKYNSLREAIGGEEPGLSHFLHRLADIERETKSHIAVELELINKNNRKKFPAIWEMTQKGISIRQILDFYKLIRREALYERAK
ncbi:MAG: hypothetical protein ABIM30_09210 [candidate division WOR-3 bacterium]